MKLSSTRLAASLMLVLPLVLVASATPAFAKIEIKKITFDPKGRDDGSNEHLVKEFVLIENTGSRRKSLEGWKLHDKGRDHRYTFGELTLRGGEYVRVRSGAGDDSGTTGCNGHCFTYYDSFWDLDNYVWNNDGDVTTLKKPGGKVIDRCRYGNSADSPKRC